MRHTIKTIVIALFIGAIFLTGCSKEKEQITSDNVVAEQSIPEDTENPDKTEDADATDTAETTDNTVASLEVHFIDVGQGDATLLVCGGHSLLIDAGNAHSGTTIQLYLKKQNIHVLDAVIWTHPDADHIGGADVITTKYEIGTIWANGNTTDTRAYEELSDSMKNRWLSAKVPSAGSSFELGDATVKFLSDTSLFDGNDASLIIMVEHGSKRFLYTGDAEYNAEQALVESGTEIDCDVYQAGHHGSSSSSSDAFLEAISPEDVVISCGTDNSYGHPHRETLEKLDAIGVRVYRTDMQGSIVAVSDGENITWNVLPAEYTIGDAVADTDVDKEESPTEKISGDGAEEAESADEDTDVFAYIGNKNNFKLHSSDCHGTLPAEHNRIYFDTLEEAEAAGFTKDNQCQVCFPYGN